MDDFGWIHENRRSGITSRQMLRSVGGSIYIWPNSRSINYAIELANSLGRGDLKIYSLRDLDRRDKLIGVDVCGLTIDHACRDFSVGHIEAIEAIRLRIGMKESP